jgi:hypothetical protein
VRGYRIGGFKSEVQRGYDASVAALTMVTIKLSADGGTGAVHQLSYRVLLMSGLLEYGNLVPFGLGEMCVVHSGQL